MSVTGNQAQPGAISEESRAVAQAAMNDWAFRNARYQTFLNYYAGLHAFGFATNKFATVFGKTFASFRSNLCPAVVDAVVDRLTVNGFGVETDTLDELLTTPASVEAAEDEGTEGEDEASEAIEDMALAIWKYNRMDQRSDELHNEMSTCGDAYLLVWPDPMNPKIPLMYPQTAQSMTVRYDPEKPGVILWAAKHWLVGDYMRLTLYFADRIERYITRDKIKGTAQAQANIASTQGPNAWTGSQGFQFPKPETLIPYADDETPEVVDNPYGMVPVFHFPNNSRMGNFGKSELADALPIQDALNKTIIDTLVGSEFQALPQRWIAGLDIEYDDNGKPKPPLIEMGADRFLALAEGQVAGQFPAADLAGLLAEADAFRLDMARVTATPLHYIQPTGVPPSGEALKTMESRFVKKIVKAQITIGNVWEDAMEFCFQIMGQTVSLECQWDDPAPRSELEHMQALTLKKALGIPDETIWAEAGYADETIEQMMAQKDEAQKKSLANAQAAFNSGNVGAFDNTGGSGGNLNG
jgi:hypothetical protein